MVQGSGQKCVAAVVAAVTTVGAVGAIAAWPATSRAAVWKDGCPAFFPPEDAPPGMTDIKVHDGSAAFGALPAIDSPLGPSRVAAEGWLSTIRPETVGATIARQAGARLVLQGNLTSGPTFGLIYAGYSVPNEMRGANDNHLGDLTLSAGYRHTGYMFGPMFRSGFAIRLAGGGPLTARTAASFAGQREQVARLSPFRGANFGTEAPFTATLEYRIEMIGCRAPFVDLRVDLSRWQPGGGERAVVDVPIEVAIGAYPWEMFALYMAIGEELRAHAAPYRRLTRITLGFEVHPTAAKHVRLGLRASTFTGEAIGGAELGVTLELLVPWWKGTLE